MRNDAFDALEKVFKRRVFHPSFFEGITEPVSDVFEDEKEVVVTVELPGVKKDELKLNITEDGVSIKVEQKESQHKEEKQNGYYASYSTSRFSGHAQYVSFPSQVDAAKAKATFKNGVLELRIPKLKQEKGREMEIE